MPMRRLKHAKKKKIKLQKNNGLKPMVVSDRATNADKEGSKRGEEGDRTQHLLK
jgi:hypothetical protein